MGDVIDLDEERRKRRRVLTNCFLCRRVFSAHQVRLFHDGAEMFVLCEKCHGELSSRPLTKCPACGREVYFLYPGSPGNELAGQARETGVCAACRSASQGEDGNPGADTPL